MPSFAAAPYARPAYEEGPSRITDLIMAAGEARARAAERSGELWGSTVAGLGQMAGQAVQHYGEQKARRNAETAWSEFVDSGTWAEDPLEAFKVSQKIWGPEQGPKMFEGLLSVQKLLQGDIKTPEQAQEYLGKTAVAASKLSDENLARYWPTLSKAAGAAGLQLPEQYTPDLKPQIQEFAKAFGKQEAAKTREIKTRGPGGQDVTRIVEDVPGQEFVSEPDPALARQQAAFEETKRHNLATEAASRAAAGGSQRPVQVETVDEQGRPVTKFVTPQAGEEFVKPSGQARPVTGQQRKALNFFNRMREADEVAIQLEEGGEVDPTKIKFTPGWANFALDDVNQAYKQAQRAFTESRLRKESGATIKDSEYESDAQTYFKQSGDSPATVEQKRRMRQAVKAGIAFESGDALREFYGPEAEGMLSQLQEASKASTPAGGAPAVGEQRIVKGQMARWDGKGWVAVH